MLFLFYLVQKEQCRHVGMWLTRKMEDQKHLFKHRLVIILSCILVAPMAVCGFIQVIQDSSLSMVAKLFYCYLNFDRTIGITFYRLQNPSQMNVYSGNPEETFSTRYGNTNEKWLSHLQSTNSIRISVMNLFSPRDKT